MLSQQPAQVTTSRRLSLQEQLAEVRKSLADLQAAAIPPAAASAHGAQSSSLPKREEPPGVLELRLAGQHSGKYAIVTGQTCKGFPIWRLVSESVKGAPAVEAWLFSSKSGRWVIGGPEEKVQDFDSDSGHFASRKPHKGKWPHEVPAQGWVAYDAEAERWNTLPALELRAASYDERTSEASPSEGEEESMESYEVGPTHEEAATRIQAAERGRRTRENLKALATAAEANQAKQALDGGRPKGARSLGKRASAAAGSSSDAAFDEATASPSSSSQPPRSRNPADGRKAAEPPHFRKFAESSKAEEPSRARQIAQGSKAEEELQGFLGTGGFVFFDGGGEPIGIRSLAPSVGSSAHDNVLFGACIRYSGNAVSWRPVLDEELVDAGLACYTWVAGGCSDALKHGGFVYKLSSGTTVAFPLYETDGGLSELRGSDRAQAWMLRRHIEALSFLPVSTAGYKLRNLVAGLDMSEPTPVELPPESARRLQIPSRAASFAWIYAQHPEAQVNGSRLVNGAQCESSDPALAEKVRSRLKAALCGRADGSQLQEFFAKLDTDGSGNLNVGEFSAAVQMYVGCDVSYDELLALFKCMDEDDSGSITIPEVLDFIGVCTATNAPQFVALSRDDPAETVRSPTPNKSTPAMPRRRSVDHSSSAAPEEQWTNARIQGNSGDRSSSDMLRRSSVVQPKSSTRAHHSEEQWNSPSTQQKDVDHGTSTVLRPSNVARSSSAMPARSSAEKWNDAMPSVSGADQSTSAMPRRSSVDHFSSAVPADRWNSARHQRNDDDESTRDMLRRSSIGQPNGVSPRHSSGEHVKLPAKKQRGYIDPVVKKKARAKMMSAARTSAVGIPLRALLETVDREHADALNFEEFCSAVRKKLKLTRADISDKDIATMFQWLDTENSGSVDLAEFIEFLGAETPQGTPVTDVRTSNVQTQQKRGQIDPTIMGKVRAALGAAAHISAHGKHGGVKCSNMDNRSVATLTLPQFCQTVREQTKTGQPDVSDDEMKLFFQWMDSGGAGVIGVQELLKIVEVEAPARFRKDVLGQSDKSAQPHLESTVPGALWEPDQELGTTTPSPKGQKPRLRHGVFDADPTVPPVVLPTTNCGIPVPVAGISGRELGALNRRMPKGRKEDSPPRTPTTRRSTTEPGSPASSLPQEQSPRAALRALTAAAVRHQAVEQAKQPLRPAVAGVDFHSHSESDSDAMQRHRWDADANSDTAPLDVQAAPHLQQWQHTVQRPQLRHQQQQQQTRLHVAQAHAEHAQAQALAVAQEQMMRHVSPLPLPSTRGTGSPQPRTAPPPAPHPYPQREHVAPQRLPEPQSLKCQAQQRERLLSCSGPVPMPPNLGGPAGPADPLPVRDGIREIFDPAAGVIRSPARQERPPSPGRQMDAARSETLRPAAVGSSGSGSSADIGPASLEAYIPPMAPLVTPRATCRSQSAARSHAANAPPASAKAAARRCGEHQDRGASRSKSPKRGDPPLVAQGAAAPGRAAASRPRSRKPKRQPDPPLSPGACPYHGPLGRPDGERCSGHGGSEISPAAALNELLYRAASVEDPPIILDSRAWREAVGARETARVVAGNSEDPPLQGTSCPYHGSGRKNLARQMSCNEYEVRESRSRSRSRSPSPERTRRSPSSERARPPPRPVSAPLAPRISSRQPPAIRPTPRGQSPPARQPMRTPRNYTGPRNPKIPADSGGCARAPVDVSSCCRCAANKTSCCCHRAGGDVSACCPGTASDSISRCLRIAKAKGDERGPRDPAVKAAGATSKGSGISRKTACDTAKGPERSGHVVGNSGVFGQAATTEERVYMGFRNAQGQREGFGVMRGKDGTIYNGQWKAGQRDGHGTLFFEGGVFEGHWTAGVAEGTGTVQFKNGDAFTGEYKKSKKCGPGTYKWADGAEESGEYEDGQKVGWHRWRQQGEEWDLLYASGCVAAAKRATSSPPSTSAAPEKSLKVRRTRSLRVQQPAPQQASKGQHQSHSSRVTSGKQDFAAFRLDEAPRVLSRTVSAKA